MIHPTSTKPRTAFNTGIRFTEEHITKLNDLQSVARANTFKLSDSQLLRMLVMNAEADEELALAVAIGRPTAGEYSVETSINFMKDGVEALKKLGGDVARIDRDLGAKSAKLGAVSFNEICRALVLRTKPDVEFLGMVRAFLELERERRAANRDEKSKRDC